MTVHLLISVLAAVGTLALIGLYRATLRATLHASLLRSEDPSAPNRAKLWDEKTLPDAEDPALDLRRRIILRSVINAEYLYEKGEITEGKLEGTKNQAASLWNKLAWRDFQRGFRRNFEGGPSRGNGQAFYEFIGEPRFRVLVATVITVLGLPVCFFVVLSGSKFDDTARNFAAGTIGAILGFWLKP